jgi:hypothetical protein
MIAAHITKEDWELFSKHPWICLAIVIVIIILVWNAKK